MNVILIIEQKAPDYVYSYVWPITLPLHTSHLLHVASVVSLVHHQTIVISPLRRKNRSARDPGPSLSPRYYRFTKCSVETCWYLFYNIHTLHLTKSRAAVTMATAPKQRDWESPGCLYRRLLDAKQLIGLFTINLRINSVYSTPSPDSPLNLLAAHIYTRLRHCAWRSVLDCSCDNLCQSLSGVMWPKSCDQNHVAGLCLCNHNRG